MLTIKVDENQLEGTIKQLSFFEEMSKPSNSYEVGSFLIEGVKVTVFKTGKIFFNKSPPDKVKKILIDYFISTDDYNGFTMGSDEVGKGEKYGPLIVGACLLKNKEERALARMNGFMDSKQISNLQIFSICKNKIFENSIRSITPYYFNLHFNSNLNSIIYDLHSSAIRELISKSNLKEGKITIDKFGSSLYEKKFKKEFQTKEIEVIFVEKAEYDLSVSCASVYARYEFLKWVKLHEEKYKKIFSKMKKEEILNFKNNNEIFKLSYIK
jgi:ribonuclease HIII